jgi:hypothetical protein
MRLRSIAFALLLTLFALPTFAAPKDDDTPGARPVSPIVRIVKIIKHLLQPLDDPYISPVRP